MSLAQLWEWIENLHEEKTGTSPDEAARLYRPKRLIRLLEGHGHRVERRMNKVAQMAATGHNEYRAGRKDAVIEALKCFEEEMNRVVHEIEEVGAELSVTH